jgi:hypothetical protein
VRFALEQRAASPCIEEEEAIERTGPKNHRRPPPVFPQELVVVRVNRSETAPPCRAQAPANARVPWPNKKITVDRVI